MPEEGTCDGTLGGGHTHGIDGRESGIVGGYNYMLPGQPNLPEVFECVARQGAGLFARWQPLSGPDRDLPGSPPRWCKTAPCVRLFVAVCA